MGGDYSGENAGVCGCLSGVGRGIGCDVGGGVVEWVSRIITTVMAGLDL